MKSQQAEAAKMIRKELKENFPDTKFSVRSSSFAGGNAVHIHWKGGPNSNEVQPLVNKYQAGSFDPMVDLYEYHEDNGLPRAKYVQCTRDHD